MKRALITGGAGFIGSWLAEALLEKGWAVHIIDDLSTGQMRNIAPFKERRNFSYTIDTVLNRPRMGELVDRADVVFHLAAAVGVRLIVEEPVRTIETNIQTTELVLELCDREKKPVLLTSSSEVYGKLDKKRFSEDDDLLLGPTSRSRWCYAGSKIIDEFLAHAYFTEKGLPAVVVRLFNTIGPRQTGRYGMVVPRFVEQALGGRPITVYGDGAQRRSFTWIGDVVEALIELVDHPGAAGQIFNVGHRQDISILELAELVKELTGSASRIELVPYEAAYEAGFEDMPKRRPDTSKLEALIGFRPSLELPEMLRRIIAQAERENGRGREGAPPRTPGRDETTRDSRTVVGAHFAESRSAALGRTKN